MSYDSAGKLSVTRVMDTLFVHRFDEVPIGNVVNVEWSVLTEYRDDVISVQVVKLYLYVLLFVLV